LAFPSPFKLFADGQCRVLIKFGCVVSMICMGFVGRRTHLATRHLIRRRGYPSFSLVANDSVIILCIVFLGLIAFLDLIAHPRLYAIVLLTYLALALSFQVMVDRAAACARRYVPLSDAITAVAALCGVAGAAACFSGFDAVPFKLGTAGLTACFVLAHLKYVFAGANLLGGRFLPNTVRFMDDRAAGPPRSSSSGSGFL
jgi:hypothetical protein